MVELTNRLRKIVASLDDAKARRETGMFAAEGTKCVLDTLSHFDCVWLFATAKWLGAHPLKLGEDKICQVTRGDLERMSHFSTAPEVIAVYRIPEIKSAPVAESLQLALDRVQDPGNL